MPSARMLLILPAIAALLGTAACGSPAPATDAHSACRREWVAAFNVIFDNTISTSDVRFMHACMEKRGYKRIYDLGACKKLDASVRNAACYGPI